MHIFFSSILILFFYMVFVFLIAYFKEDNSIIDTAWGLGFILLALYSFFSAEHIVQRHILITILVLIWGFRLSGYITLKNWGKSEDPRYKAWRDAWMKYGKGYFFGRSFLQIYMLQALFLFIISLPIIVVNASTKSALSLLDIIGVLVWLTGFIFESVGDYQLLLFLKEEKNHGSILMSGLWRYTRHPNYFGEMLIWWGLFLIAINVPYGWITCISPLTISYLLFFVSGIPMTESLFDGHEEYEKYKRQTSAFFPWFVRKVA